MRAALNKIHRLKGRESLGEMISVFLIMRKLIKKSRIILDQTKPAHKDGKFWCFDLLQHSQLRVKLTIPTRMTCNVDKEEGEAIARLFSGDWEMRIR